ncbi:MAG: RNA-guided endonuclease InsQ/TnpB family protein [Planktothrix sp.]
MQLVEKHVIKKGHDFYQEIDKLCFASKNLYNAANYLIRQSFIHQGIYLNYNTIQKELQGTDVYKALPAKVSQQVLRVLDVNWRSFFAAIKEWNENPENFLGRPKLPKYKHKEKGRNLVVYTIQAMSKPLLSQQIIKLSKTDILIKTKVENIKQVRIVPKLDHYVCEVIYEKPIKVEQQLDPNKIAGVDIGLNNLATVTFNQADLKPLLVNGKPLKSINQFFNKEKAKYQSLLGDKSSHRIQRLCTKRGFKVDDYLHKASRLIIDYLLSNQVGTLVIGKNPNWKQDINMGKRNNQNFVQVPHARFIEMLRYKAELKGIFVMEQEESYTSKASFLDSDFIPNYSKEQPRSFSFSGKRICRGLYQSANGKRLNADVNGSLNIIRKAVPNAFGNGIEGVVVHPVRVTPTK